MTEHKAVAERFIGSLRSLVFLAILMVATSASALTLNEARSQGLIGERPDGLIGAVSASAASDVVALVSEINAARLRQYQSLSQRDGAPLQAVQAIAGEKLTATARQNGWYVMDSSGRWSR